jgi:hypothetical protein
LQLSEIVLGKSQTVLRVFGLLQLVAAVQPELVLIINGGAQVVAAVKLHRKLFQLPQETR